jgi:transcriptional regulator with XRE-family HTH domain
MIAEPRTAPRPVAASEGEEQTFGRLIRSARERQGISPRRLAGIVGISHAGIAWVETDRWDPGGPVRAKLTQALGLPGWMAEPPPPKPRSRPVAVPDEPAPAPAAEAEPSLELAAQGAEAEGQALGRMFGCPACGSRGRVVDSRQNAIGIRRRRECQEHGHRWTTVEVAGQLDVFVSALAGAVTARDALDKAIGAFRGL